jgi:ribonuclease P protein component
MDERRGGTRHRRPRLTRSADFDRVYRRGRSAATRSFVLYAFPSTPAEDDAQDRPEGKDDVRLGVSVGRRVGGAVERNRVKRVLREAFWALDDQLPEGHDFVIVARAGAAETVAQADLDGVRAELAELLERLATTGAERRA